MELIYKFEMYICIFYSFSFGSGMGLMYGIGDIFLNKVPKISLIFLKIWQYQIDTLGHSINLNSKGRGKEGKEEMKIYCYNFLTLHVK